MNFLPIIFAPIFAVAVGGAFHAFFRFGLPALFGPPAAEPVVDPKAALRARMAAIGIAPVPMWGQGTSGITNAHLR
jgi:hypothetical protein